MFTFESVSKKINDACNFAADFAVEHPYITGVIGGCIGGVAGLIIYNLGMENGIRTAIPEAHKAGVRYGKKLAYDQISSALYYRAPDIYNAAGDILENEGFIKPFTHATNN